MEDCSTDERLQQETLCHRQWTDEYVELPETLMRQNVQRSRRLTAVHVLTAGRRSSSHIVYPAFTGLERRRNDGDYWGGERRGR